MTKSGNTRPAPFQRLMGRGAGHFLTEGYIMPPSMNHGDHKERHIVLHRILDELVADWMIHTNNRPSSSTVLDLMIWSSEQAKDPSLLTASGIANHD